MSSLRNALLIVITMACTSLSYAEQKVAFDGHELHYIVFNSTEIAPDIAENYGLVRSGRRAFINLAVLEMVDERYGTPVPADITVTQRSLLGQQQNIPLTEIREGSAIYYIATFPIIDREVLWFDVDLVVDDGPSFQFTFDEQVWQE